MLASTAMRQLPPRSLAGALTGLLLVAMAVACCHAIILPTDHHDASSCAICGHLYSAVLCPVAALPGAVLAMGCLRPRSEARITSRPPICYRGRSPPIHLIYIRCP